jgi:hypothetical protein
MARLTKERYEVEWWVLTDAAKARKAREQTEAGYIYEHDRDQDEQSMFEVFLKEKDALAFARKVVDEYQTVYGHATVTKQRLENVEGTRMWEWEDIGEPTYVE